MEHPDDPGRTCDFNESCAGVGVGAAVCLVTTGGILWIVNSLFWGGAYWETNRVLELFYYAFLTTFFAAFSLRALNWSGSKAFLLALLPLGVLAGVILCARIGIRALHDLVSCAIWLCAWALVAIPWALGVLAAAQIARRVRTPGNRRRAFLAVAASCALGLSLPTAVEKGVEWYTSSHAAVAGLPALECDARDLHQTVVTATLDAPILKGTNLLWCASFPIAWNELADLCGGTVDMADPPGVVAVLNRKDITTNDLDTSSFVAAAGPVETVVPQLRAELTSKLRGQASPVLRPASDKGIFAYAYLFVNLPFESAFERLPFPMLFGTNLVECFGTINVHNPGQDRAGRQLIVHDYRDAGNFIAELQTRRRDHELILAMIPPAETIGETIRIVNERLHLPRGSQERHWLLRVPVLNFDLTRDYEELRGHEVRGHGKFAFAMPLIECRQQVRFRLDERGAVLRSEAAMTAGRPPSVCFDKPFLILLRLRGRENPYFALWVDNAEILVPSRRAAE